MSSLLLFAGWTANALFFGRFFLQWLASERAHRSVAPKAFWWVSLCGALLLALYLLSIGEPVLLAGCAINAAIYARNLVVAGAPEGRRLTPAMATCFGLLAALVLLAILFVETGPQWGHSAGWLTVSVLGQGFWSTRFLLQWWATERRGRSHFPRGFWWLSLAGNGLLLGYALHLADPILVLGYLPGPLVQVRNLMLSRRLGAHAVEAA